MSAPAPMTLVPSVFPGVRALRGLREPRLFKGLAADWRAVRAWSFERIAHIAPPIEVSLVEGNREREGTRFVRAPLREHLASLAAAPQAGTLRQLKEFDLLAAIPTLRADLRYDMLMPRSDLRSIRGWIGPAAGSTGLHHDLLDNLAVQIAGTKRFRLLPPGSVERAGRVSPKYDAWAVLASCDADTVAAADPASAGYIVDLEPGDVLHLPAGWWHEVSSTSAAILLGGFHGAPLPVLARWGWVQAREALHRVGLLGRAGCTCHAQRASGLRDGRVAAG